MGSRTSTWIAVMLVFLISYPKQSDGGPVAFGACLTSAAGPVCTSVLQPALVTCGAVAWAPPMWTACMTGILGVACGGPFLVCSASFFAPTP